MADSSSDSDTCLHNLPRRRGPLKATTKGRSRMHNAGDVTEKIDTLASTLQDTSRDLTNVDRMLGRYRGYTNEQMEAVSQLRDDLEQSIDELRSRRLSRHSGHPIPPLRTSDLQGNSATKSHRYRPTSPLRDPAGYLGTDRRRSRSATVRFVDDVEPINHVHTLHRSLRDLRSDQLRLGEEFDEEITNRNRTDVETRKAVNSLSEKLRDMSRTETVSERVERRLQEIEKEMRIERQLAERRQDQLGHMAVQLKEELKKRGGKIDELEEMKSKLSRSEDEKSLIEQDLSRTRRRLDQSEGSRETLASQVLSSDLEKREKQQLRMLSQLQEIQNRYDDCMQDRKSADLEIVDLTRQLKESSVEADRCRTQLKEVELLRMESEKKKDELKIKAQESIKQWKVKCKKLERDVEKQKEIIDQRTEQLNQENKEKQALQGQQTVALNQMENLRKELNDVLLKRAQQEEDMRWKDVELNELKSGLLDLDGKLRDSKESLSKLEVDLHKQCMLHTQTKEEKQHLEDELMALSRQNEKGQEKVLEMQRVNSELSAIRSELSTKLAQEEKSNKEIRKSISEAQAKQVFAQEELASLKSQLKLERDAHQQELAGIRSEMQTLRTKHEKNMQEVLKQFQQERDKLENSISELKTELADHKNLAKTQRHQMEKVKTECNKLTEELIQGEAENTKLRRKYHLLKQELEEKGKLAVNGEECVRQLEQMTFQLKDQIRRIQTEQETILCAVGKEIDAACDFLSRDPGDRFKAITLSPGLENDPHRWLAEMKTKLQWLCEEVKERDGREHKLRCHLRQCRGQLKELLQDKESESQLFIEQITKQEHLLEEIHKEKKELLQKMYQKDEEMRALQVQYNDRIADLESNTESWHTFHFRNSVRIKQGQSTRMALDHLESVPERLSILDGIRDLEDSQRQREMIEERYSKYKEIVSSLQQQLRDSTRRIQEYQEEASDTSLWNERLDGLPVTQRDQNGSPTSCFTADAGSPNGSSRRRNLPSGKGDASQGSELSRAANGRKSPAEKDKY
ncbi:centrosomal protein of 128 kDa-like isoform X7 [Heterodontus francisci]|uniref:centrosomal protein of 128 kDa-like isoform X7 n=1 Tax=Heterodontus francisci TaxID=7792 RepID=UPI00355C732E